MKKLFTLSVSLLFVAFAFVNAQSLKIVSADTFLTGPANEIFQADLKITNSSLKSITVMVERTLNDTAVNHRSSFCWDACYGPGTSVSPDPVIMNSGDTVNQFKGDLNTNNVEGITTVEYCFFDRDNTSDRVCKKIVYDVKPAQVGINNMFTYNNGSKLYQVSPNPVNAEAKIKYSLNRNYNKAYIKVLDVLGNVIQTKPLTEVEGIADFEMNTLAPGIYLYLLNVDGNTVGTRKFIKN